MLLHYLGKLKIQIFSKCGRKRKQIAFLIASNFVIHPQILIFLVTANKIFHVTVLLLVYFCDQFAAPKIRHSRRHCSVCQRSTWYSATRKRFWFKKIVFEGVRSKEVDIWISWKKAGQSVVLISCWKSCGTQVPMTGGQAAADRAVKTK